MGGEYLPDTHRELGEAERKNLVLMLARGMRTDVEPDALQLRAAEQIVVWLTTPRTAQRGTL